MRIVTASAFLLLVYAALAQQPPAGQPENTGPNASIARWASGMYAYQTDDGQRQRGWERFHLNVHPDGTRTMIMWHDLFARNSQFSVMMRVAPDFRPLQAFANYWTVAGYKGSITIAVDGDRLRVTSDGPLGQMTQAVRAPRNFSIGSHPVSADGWHTWYEDLAAKGVQKSGQIYGIDASADLSRPLLGQLRPHEFEIVGREKITVPAGTFDATKYQSGGSPEGAVQMWVATEDRIMIRTLIPGRRTDYLLTEFTSGTNTKK
ncbi:MAG: hypothetical protein FJX59_14945 [Alphaproteobacteria bacterium]|nr:hypothetical protein [Alphaproteobacteria bacterium]